MRKGACKKGGKMGVIRGIRYLKTFWGGGKITVRQGADNPRYGYATIEN